ncbi:sulfotransferase family 2 domain-containing protein [Pseudogemmobacter blasticus]|uniref:Sulfotransferase family protein n=1 Tax=Fuscovulum blasticum DSM 2131 TaxID=1188250 RepID=A0A2T4J727_FUSBL|nr:sulfotransferase family 2 domain-containing protein [Fuscovulum blasticum]PTE13627.1 hypothetical protein C5F44_12530 [Fuscovulum blasticum DSM 2131]
MPRPATLFFPAPASDAAQRLARAAAFRAATGTAFASDAAALGFLSGVFLPRSGRWAYAATPKAASSSLKRLLFELEFGLPLPGDVTDPEDPNGDAPATRVLSSRLICPLWELDDPAAALSGALRITAVRDPELRAISGFKHICRSHVLKHVPYYTDRLHISALTGLNWAKESYRPSGFEKFLEFIAACYADNRADLVDPHWQRQVDSIMPQVFRPDLIAHVEDLNPFLHQIADRLGAPLPQDFVMPHSNASPDQTGRELITPRAAELIRQIYAADYAAFGYSTEIGPFPEPPTGQP